MIFNIYGLGFSLLTILHHVREIGINLFTWHLCSLVFALYVAANIDTRGEQLKVEGVRSMAINRALFVVPVVLLSLLSFM